MKSFKGFTLAAAVLALVSVGAFAAPNSSTTTVGLTATVSSFDNITCTQTSVDLNNGVNITASGLTTGHVINCFVTSNDTSAIDATAYLPDASPLTGTNPSNTIPNSDIEWSASSGGTYVALSALGGSLSGNDGAIVATNVGTGNAIPVTFYLKLNVPAGQPADSYSATLTVAITPELT